MASTIPVDLLNPGQVFACLGIVELAELLCGEVAAGFDWSDPATPLFAISADAVDPITAGLEFLAEAEVRAIAPRGSALETSKWDVACQSASGMAYPIPPPSSSATLVAVLSSGEHTITIHSWGDGRLPGRLTAKRDNVKFWAGSGGYPGAALLRDALALVRSEIVAARPDPFALTVPQSSSFRFDWRRDYVPIDAGFSLNAHGKNFQPAGYPVVEILAALGLSHARPRRHEKLRYSYSVAGRAEPDDRLLPPSLLRAALGTGSLPFPTRTFTMQLDWPGQENQARCITTVSEEAQ